MSPEQFDTLHRDLQAIGASLESLSNAVCVFVFVIIFYGVFRFVNSALK